MSETRCRRVSEASPLDNDVHTYVPVSVTVRTAFHLVVDEHPLQEAGGRVDHRLVLVYLRACAVAQTCMSRVGVRCTTGGARRCQVLLDPPMLPPCVQELLG